MGSKFVEKHKRKSVLAALLFLFQGRAKYVGILLILAILSVPFVISGETLSRIIELRPVAAFLRTVGLGSVISAMNPKYSNDLLKAAMEKAANDSEQNSFWAKFLKSVNATMPPGGGPSSLAMIRGGADDIFGPLELKDGKYGKYGKRGAGDVDGAVNDEERQRGETGDEVNLEGLLAGAGGRGAGGADGGLYGDLMGQNLAGNFAGGSASSGAGPYMNRTMLRNSGGAGGRASGMYNKVLGGAAAKVPLHGASAKVRTKTMGRVSGFAWKNVGYKSKNARVDTKLGSKKPMFQLAETAAMTSAGSKSRDSAYEYQAAYTGATYDGNDVNLDVIETDSSSPSVPDTSFIDSTISDIGGVETQAKECNKAQGTNGSQMSQESKQMDEISQTLGSPPKCCSGGVGAWNGKLDRIIGHCQGYNVNEAQLAATCGVASNQMDCNVYGKMKIKPCSKWKCFFAILLMIFIGFLLFGFLGALIVGVIAAGSVMGGGAFGGLGEIVGGFISKIAGGE